MNQEERYSKTIRVRIDEELLERIIEEAEKLNTDLSSYVRWCIRTGLYLEDLSMFLQSRIKENH